MTQDGALTIQTQYAAQEKTHSALEHSFLLAFLQQPRLRFPETALPGEAVVSKEGQRNPSTWSL